MSNHSAHENHASELTDVGRADVTFNSGGQRCDGWLFRPPAATSGLGVVLAHGIGGIKGAALPDFARRFAAAGFPALVFDYRHLGTSEGTPRGLVDIRQQQQDLRAAIAFMRDVDVVNPDRIVLWGTSFGSGHVLSLAARDPSLAAAMIQNPFVDGRATAAMSLRTAGTARTVALAWLGLRDEVRRLRGRDPLRVNLTGPPGSLAMMTTEDAEPGFASILPDDPAGWEPSVAARIMVRMRHYRPGLEAHRVECPLHVSVCDHDRLAPPGPALKVAAEVPRGSAQRYPIGHFDLFAEPWLDRVTTDQIGFLSRVRDEAGISSR